MRLKRRRQLKVECNGFVKVHKTGRANKLSIPEYFAPETLEEACSLLSEHKDNARVIAGGTDLLLKMRQGDVLPEYIINIRNIPVALKGGF